MFGLSTTTSSNAEYHRVPDDNDAIDKERHGDLTTQDIELGIPGGRDEPAVERKQESGRVHATAWLDGLRGFAAFFVVLHHMTIIWFPWSVYNAYGADPDSYLLFQLPIVRLIITGHIQVAIFLVISGYALSLKTLKFLHKGQVGEAHNALVSSAFRRHPRLFIPPIVVCFFSMFFAWMNWYGNGARMPGAATPVVNPPIFESFWDQLIDYLKWCWRLADPLTRAVPSGEWVYDNPLWTLPYEFRGSFLVYGILLALSRARPVVRIITTALLAIHALCFVYHTMFLFIVGLLIADLKLWDPDVAGFVQDLADRVHIKLPAIRLGKTERHQRFLWGVLSLFGFFVALWIGSIPNFHRGGKDAFGYRTLSALIPMNWHAQGQQDNYWVCIAAALLIFVVDRTPLLQKLYTNRLGLFLGRISFALYLVHVPILHSFGWWAGNTFIKMTGSDTFAGYDFGIAIAWILDLSITIVVAHFVERFVDAKAVRFAGWLYQKFGKGA
ncbi:hypothetical protein JX266_006786 [Neoarthrinium moseri]|nr:hypothetical protein JX266_006786 [Neoarthrinium moseri]